MPCRVKIINPCEKKGEKVAATFLQPISSELGGRKEEAVKSAVQLPQPLVQLCS